jgi:chemotaxis protein MotB
MAQMPKPRKHAEKAPNHERWIISYADLLTLLLATFVVLYASSTRNHRKMEEVARSFLAAFHGSPPAVTIPQPTGSRGVLKNLQSPVPQKVEAPNRAQAQIPEKIAKQLTHNMQALQQLQLQLRNLFQPMLQKGQVSIRSEPLTLTIQLDASVLFDSGEAVLKPAAVALLSQVGKGLVNLPPGFLVTVQGYTDNQPIATSQFPSNWSLSAERAVAVVQLFQQSGVNGNNLTAEGFGEFSPAASNDEAQGRALNRRVVIVVHAADPTTSNPTGK